MLTFFIRRPRFAMVIALLLTFVGAVSLKLIPVEQYPAITPPVVNVSASWPGASASDVAEAIAAPLETQLNGVDHMLYMESTSSDEGTYRLSITFAAGTDADLAAIDVQNRVAQALAQLPAEVQQNGVQVRKRASNLLMGVSLYSPLGTLTPLFVSNYASTQVREALARLPGVGEVQMFGARDYSMRIWLRPDRMNALNITTDDVAQALREQNVQGAAGQVGTPPVFNGQQQTLTINGLGRLNEAASFGEIILRRGAQGQLVRLADVATIELGARSYSSGAQLNGKASAYLGIYPTPTANALQVASAVRAELNRLHTRFPADLTWEVKFDTTRFVAATIKEIGVSLALTLLALFMILELYNATQRIAMNGSNNAFTIQQIALVMLKIVVCRWAVVHTTEILNALFEVASTVTVGISGYVGSGEVNTTVDIENAIAALPGGIGNMPVALELMVVGWMLRIVNIVVNTIVAARFIELYVYNAMASLSIATLCYQELHGIAVNFLKSYLAVALQGAVLYLVIGFYPALAGSLGTGGSITEQAWAMLGQSVILLVAVFMSGKFTKAITNAMT